MTLKAGTIIVNLQKWEREDVKKDIERLCADKAAEFVLYGYENVTGQQVWACVSEKYKEDGNLPPLYQLVNDILSLKVTTYMNWMMLNAYKGKN